MDIAVLLRRLSEYQRACVGDEGLNDFQARDFGNLINKSKIVLEEFLANTDDRTEPVVEKHGSSIGLSAQDAVRFATEVLKLYNAIKGHQPDTVYHTETHRDRKGRRDHHRRRKYSSSDDDDEEEEEDENEKEDRSIELTSKTGLASSFIAAGTAAGAVMITMSSMKRVQEYGEKVSEIEKLREGHEEELNGDLSVVNIQNTGSLIAQDASAVVESLVMDGVTLSEELRATPNQVRDLADTIHDTLLKVEAGYEAQKESSQGTLWLGVSAGATSLLALVQLWILKVRKSRFLATSMGSILFNAILYIRHRSHVAQLSREVERSRTKALRTLFNLQNLQLTLSQRKAAIAAASAAYRAEKNKPTLNVTQKVTDETRKQKTPNKVPVST